MNYYKCPKCAGERSTETPKVLVICPCCQIAMEKIAYPHKKNVEVINNGYRGEIQAD